MSLLEGLALHAELSLGHVFGYSRSWHVSIAQSIATNNIQIDVTLFGNHTLSRIVRPDSMDSPDSVEREVQSIAANLISQLFRSFNMQTNLSESPRQCFSRLVDTVGIYRLCRREPPPPPHPEPEMPTWPVWTEGRVDWGENPSGSIQVPIEWEAFVVAVLEAAIDEIPSFVRGEVLIGGGRFRTVGELTNYVLNQIANIRNEARPSESQFTAIPIQAQKPTSHVRRIEL